jgi:hypothetical protein
MLKIIWSCSNYGTVLPLWKIKCSKLSAPRVKLVPRVCFNRDRRAFIDLVF